MRPILHFWARGPPDSPAQEAHASPERDAYFQVGALQGRRACGSLLLAWLLFTRANQKGKSGFTLSNRIAKTGCETANQWRESDLKRKWHEWTLCGWHTPEVLFSRLFCGAGGGEGWGVHWHCVHTCERVYNAAFSLLGVMSTEYFDACNIIWGAVVLIAGLKKMGRPKTFHSWL